MRKTDGLSQRAPKLLTFGSGGWVLALAVLICISLVGWALGPALVGWAKRPPGDGASLESYEFDLSDLQVSRDLIFAAMPHRDAAQTLDDPAIIAGDALGDLNRRRGKYVVSSDRVVGVTIDGVSRAYPISVLTVHEIVHDELGGRPIAVTYHWPCDSVAVFDRRVGERTVSFGVSGLLYNSNLLMYERSAAGRGGEPLWSQLAARAVSGAPARAGERLEVIPAVLTSWEQWLRVHPDTTLIDRDPSIVKKRYRKSNPAEYFLKGKIVYPVRPLPPDNGLRPLERVVAVDVDGDRRVYPLLLLRDRSEREDVVTEELGGVELRFDFDAASGTVQVSATNDAPPPAVSHAAWFAWHAFHPEDELIWEGTESLSP